MRVWGSPGSPLTPAEPHFLCVRSWGNSGHRLPWPWMCLFSILFRAKARQTSRLPEGAPGAQAQCVLPVRRELRQTEPELARSLFSAHGSCDFGLIHCPL